MCSLLDELTERARAATPIRDPRWQTVMLSPDAVVFHTPEQLRAFVEAEIRRAFIHNQVPVKR